MAIQPIKRVSVSELVYEQLQDNLIKGVWKAGEKIPSENELAAQFEVSRVSVRQALSKLAALGLLETRQGEGNFVRAISAQDYVSGLLPYMENRSDVLEETLEFRLIIEVGAVRLACRKAQQEDIVRLKRSKQRMEEHREDHEEYVKEDLHFHMIIIKMADNSMLTQIAEIVREIIRKAIYKITTDIGVENGLFYHEKLIEAFEKREEELAENVMREHLRTSMEAFRKHGS